jgi:tetratricopeptide (TPR) repeat protein
VWIYLGQNANREHHIDEAEKDFRKAIDLTGADEQRNNYQIRRAYFSLGRLLVASGRRDEGLKLLEKYKAAQQAAVAAGGNKIGTMAAGEDAPAALDTTSAHKAASEPVTAEHFQTNLTEAQQTTLKAEKATLLQMLADGFNDLGTAEARLQQYDSALKYFLEAEKWEPPNRVLLRNIGAAAFRADDFAEAARALSVYAKTGERDDRANLMLAFSQFNQGRFADAAAAFGASSAAAMADDRAAYSYAFSLARSGHAQEANAIANELTTRTLPAEILSLVCHIYVDSENYQGSLDCYRKAYVQDPSLTLAHYEAGQALVHLDRPQEAIAELEAELNLQPDDPNIQYSLGYALLQASRKKEAQQKFEQVIAGHPDQGPAQYQLGKLLLDSGKVNDAIMHLEASEKSDSGPDYTHYQLGVAYRKAGRATDAEREFKLYREIKDRNRDASAVPAAAKQ